VEAELKDTPGVNVALEQGSGGIFEVWADRQLVFNKATTGRFPEPGEVERLLREAGS
jgi:predicted Rdx family selenoprotein